VLKTTSSESLTPIFGGSVRKHTHVDGVSDIDSLLVLRGEGLSDLDPAQALDFFETTVRADFPGTKVERDKMSVTIHREGLVLQILPAIRRQGELFIPTLELTGLCEEVPPLAPNWGLIKRNFSRFTNGI
jgi:hypothetical protein